MMMIIRLVALSTRTYSVGMLVRAQVAWESGPLTVYSDSGGAFLPADVVALYSHAPINDCIGYPVANSFPRPRVRTTSTAH